MHRMTWGLRCSAVAAVLLLGLACTGGGSTSNDHPAPNQPPTVNAGADIGRPSASLCRRIGIPTDAGNLDLMSCHELKMTREGASKKLIAHA